MGVVGSLPSPPLPSSIVNATVKTLYEESIPSSIVNDTVKTLYEELIPPCDECKYCVLTMDTLDSNSNFSSNSNSNSNSTLNIDNQNESNNSEQSNSKSPIDGPVNVRVRRYTAPTLETGRRSKFMKLEGDAAVKRELRRKRNRDAARKLKEKRIILEQQLENDIHELESKEQELLSRVGNLELHKNQLEIQYKHVITVQETLARTASSTLKHIHRNRRRLHHKVSSHRNDTYIKEEPEPPSPQWQLYFSI